MTKDGFDPSSEALSGLRSSDSKAYRGTGAWDGGDGRGRRLSAAEAVFQGTLCR